MAEECNVDDILCQMGVLQNLRGLQTGMGNETFLKEFPELQGMDEKLTAKIEQGTANLKESLAKCGQIASEELPEPIEAKANRNRWLEPGPKVEEVPEEE